MQAETEVVAASPVRGEDGYDALSRVVPLRPINNEAEYHRALAQIDALIDREGELSPGEQDYMTVLGLIVGHHEDGLYGEPPEDPEADAKGGE